jgi:hypothetical protein
MTDKYNANQLPEDKKQEALAALAETGTHSCGLLLSARALHRISVFQPVWPLQNTASSLLYFKVSNSVKRCVAILFVLVHHRVGR